MSHEWPLPKVALEEAEPLLPLALDEHIAVIRSSPAIDAIARKRAVQILAHGHTPEADLDKPPAELAREAKARLHAFLDYMPVKQMNLPAARREQLLRYIEVSGALLVALWERCQVEVPE